MQDKPTPHQVSAALAVIENANDADALALAEAAIHAAWKWRVLEELAIGVDEQDPEASAAVWSAFETVQ